MTELLQLHPHNPQQRLLARAVQALRAGAVIVYPTDSCYAFGCPIGSKDALERIRRLRQADRHHHFTLVCCDLAQAGRFARLDTWQFRLLRQITPGPYTFLLPATRETPRRLQHAKRRTIGIRIPDHPVPQMLLQMLGEPLMSSTLLLPGASEPLTDGMTIFSCLRGQVDLVLDGGYCGTEPTTVLDLAVRPLRLVRQGKGPLPAGLVGTAP
ncbi:MAG: L-threonylcarbamoyladenylate synthase [Steroidobacteraceae bacterium]|nr:L-threonylcarbamoyladenylate synthase [Steroidobacteraceae bacterium]MDW8258407.1 L-threonylcarbamoyladenylate synthase [Gammaproteobacteria bacterium]